MNPQIFAQARRYAINRLEHELSPDLLYHGIAHTRDEVIPAVERLADLEGIQGESLYLLLTTAWFHDIGYVEQATHHELIGARIAMQVLPSFGYRESEVEIVRWAILATALPQSPTSLLEEILVDADLDVLGREDFMQRNKDLRCELALLGKEFTDEEWYTRQLKFVQEHKYFTTSARSSRNTQKSLNIAKLKNMLKEFTRE
ncbi:MAG TPA: hypothetical protein VFR47_32335 [Anaerolineales bacterium]|nr:hypothetical protein [Anaerolineales bacterium]